jgi:S1-C subfamily serine protease
MKTLSSKLSSALAPLFALSACAFASGCAMPGVDENLEQASHKLVVDIPVAQNAWIVGPFDARRMTAFIKVAPTKGLRSSFERSAALANDPERAAAFKGAAEGGTGSGVVIVRLQGGQKRAYVLTNRHVVDEAETADVQFADGTSYLASEIVYASPTVDVALIALPEAAAKQFPYGVEFSSKPAEDRDPVVSSGYPKGSYQITDGKISNRELKLSSGTYLQHTAPIDPGSSGGPIMSAKGTLLGLNAAMLTKRQAANLAVPVALVEAAAEKAFERIQARTDASRMEADLNASCAALAGELSSPSSAGIELVPYVSNKMVEQSGYESLRQLDKVGHLHLIGDDDDLTPTVVLRRAVVSRLFVEKSLTRFSPSCSRINEADRAKLETREGLVRISLQTDSGQRETSWIFEQGNWKLAQAEFAELKLKEAPKSKEKSGAKPTKASARSAR